MPATPPPAPSVVSVSTSSSTISRPPPHRRATIFITSDAVEFLSQSAPATVLRNHPGTFHVRRIMAHVLIMAAFQLRHPVTFFIQMKSSDLSLHCRRSPQAARSPAVESSAYRPQRSANPETPHTIRPS